MSFRPTVDSKAVADVCVFIAKKSIKDQGGDVDDFDFDYERDVTKLQQYQLGEHVLPLLTAAQPATVLAVLRALNDELSGVPMEQRGERMQQIYIDAEIEASDF